MRSILGAMVFFLAISVLQGQSNAPDYSDIKKLVAKEKSETYYPKLYAELLSGKKALTLEQYKLLYYGFRFTNKYQPLDQAFHGPDADFQQMYMDENQLSRYIDSLDLLLADHPVEPGLMFTKYYVLEMQNKSQEAQIWLAHFSGIVNAIMSSGNGSSCESAYHVLQKEHAQFVLEAYNRMNVVDQRMEGNCYIPIWREKEDQDSDLYFNISSALENREDWKDGKAPKRKIEL